MGNPHSSVAVRLGEPRSDDHGGACRAQETWLILHHLVVLAHRRDHPLPLWDSHRCISQKELAQNISLKCFHTYLSYLPSNSSKKSSKEVSCVALAKHAPLRLQSKRCSQKCSEWDILLQTSISLPGLPVLFITIVIYKVKLHLIKGYT